MARSADQRSPLALTVLALLIEEPMHPYLMQRLIKQRGKDQVVNVARSASVYQAIERLERAGLITVHEIAAAPGKPDRIIYRITEQGRSTLYRWIDIMLSEPRREYPEFPAVLSVVMLHDPARVRRLLQARAETLTAQLADLDTVSAEHVHLPRVALIEDTYRAAMLRAELDWIRSIDADLHSGTLTWTENEIITAAQRSRDAIADT
ncbi:PadR family transcriptional regulator [Nocardia sp. NPDC005998]|uniref:PadR family transcriptional regulator n=1 Tax=Nocardia sp. NPDC005998 TaxID=3156894 RepID=UPI0033BFB5CD